jgi:hypothetical protein
MKLYVILATLALVQAQDLPPIRGTVVEYGSKTPVVSAEVVLDEFTTVDGVYGRKPVARTVTDSKGAFTLTPTRAGEHWVSVHKAAYLDYEDLAPMHLMAGVHAEGPYTVDHGPAKPDLRFVIVRTASLTGRVVDEDGKPVSNMRVQLLPGNAPGVETNLDGVFMFTKLMPDPLAIRLGPISFADVRDYTSEQMRETQDFEISYWPGGVDDPKLALPLALSPGATTDMGTLRLRKIPYYRAHVALDGDCGGTRRAFILDAMTSIRFTSCSKDVLLDHLRPGEHTLYISENGPGSEGVQRWAIATFAVSRENIEVKVDMRSSIEVAGRIVAPSGTKTTDLPLALVHLRFPHLSLIRAVDSTKDGTFRMTNVAWQKAQIEVDLQSPEYAVKEIRYGGLPVTNHELFLTPGAQVEITLDDQPASVSGTLPPDTIAMLSRWPLADPVGPVGTGGFALGPDALRAPPQGTYRISGLSPGEYVIAAVSRSASDINAVLTSGRRFTLKRGEVLNLDLK